MGAARQAPAEEEHGDQSQADKAQRVDACWPVKLGIQQNRFCCIKVRSGRRPIHGWESVAVVTRGASSQRRAVPHWNSCRPCLPVLLFSVEDADWYYIKALCFI